MANTNYFELQLTATTTKLYDYLTNTCLSHGSYLNPLRLGSFIHGKTNNTYDKGDHHIPSIDESLPEIDKSYNGIKWLASKSKWLDYDSRIKTPQLQYVEIINMNPFGDEKSGYSNPMTKEDWKKYFLPDDNSGNFIAAPNGHLYLTPSEDGDDKEVSVLISQKSQNDGIIAAFNVAFTLEVDKVVYSCIIDPVIKVFSPKN